MLSWLEIKEQMLITVEHDDLLNWYFYSVKKSIKVKVMLNKTN